MRVPLENIKGPHEDSFVVTQSLTDTPKGAMILLHGRGATAQNIIGLGRTLDKHGEYNYIAPQAVGNEWYPHSFLEPVSRNEPHLSSALTVVDASIEYVLTEGFSHREMYIGGFSQGACLAAEYIARSPSRYGGVFILSGGLIGETIRADTYSGDLQDTPIFLGCGTADHHIPVDRVKETATVFKKLNGAVEMQLFTDMSHTIHEKEVAMVQEMLYTG